MVQHVSVGRFITHASAYGCFATLARCFGTFSNYLGHLRGACHAMGFEAPPVGHTAIKRAMVAIIKRELHRPRSKRFINKREALQTGQPVANHDPLLA